MSRAPFAHVHAAHCETGVISALFAHGGFPITEPMAFGIGCGIAFVHVPFLKVMGIPLTSFRTLPGRIFAGAARRLGVRYVNQTFRSRDGARRALDELLDRGQPVGMQVNIYWLAYFPPQFRFQFNGHNLVVFGRGADGYAVSDPMIEQPVVCPPEMLERARFAAGPFKPRGRIYYPVEFPREPDVPRAIWRGVKMACRMMLGAPSRLIGCRGIATLGKRVQRYPDTLRDLGRAKLFLGNIVRMQEEVGTGGAGFRFMYAAFLDQAAAATGHDGLARAAEMMTAAGDVWRGFASDAARLIKDRDGGARDFKSLGETLLECASREREVFRYLNGLKAR